MSSGTQVDLDWAGTDAAQDGAGAASAALTNDAAGSVYLTDEEILGVESPSPNGRFGAPGPHASGTSASSVIPSEARNLSSIADDGEAGIQRDSSGENRPRNDKSEAAAEATSAENRQAEASPGGMPAWMAAAAADPRHSAEAQALWREHQEFRAAFGSPEEARAVKELLPGGVRDVLSLREATQSVERIDAAIFSGDARAQADVVAELARANPAAFRSLFAEAAKVVAGLGSSRTGFSLSPSRSGSEAGNNGAGSTEAGGPSSPQNGFGKQARSFDGSASSDLSASSTLRFDSGQALRFDSGQALRTDRERRGSRSASTFVIPSEARDLSERVAERMGNAQRDSSGQNRPRNDNVVERAENFSRRIQASNLENSPVTSHESPVTAHAFDPAAYAAFERATNDAVARDVRGSIHDTLARVLPEGVAEGAARRIGEDIFQEVHRALAADRSLSEQVAGVLSARRFGGAEQQRVASLLAGRARQIVPGVARRVIGEWTSTVLNTARGKAARQAAAASRVDIAAPGGSRDSMPLRQMSPREVNYASMSDEEILGI